MEKIISKTSTTIFSGSKMKGVCATCQFWDCDSREIKEFASNNNGMPIWDIEAIKKRKQSMIEAAMEIWSLDNI